MPAYVGVLLVLIGAHRQTVWLANTLGLLPGTCIAALTWAIAAVQLAAAAIALGGGALVAEPTGETLLWLAAATLVVALGAALACTRVLLGSQDSETVAARVVIGASPSPSPSPPPPSSASASSGTPSPRFATAGLLAVMTART